MALHILQGGTNTGGRLGEALGTGLQALAQHKIGQLQQRQQQARNVMGLEALGLNPQQAQSLSQLDPQALQEIVKSQLQSQREKEFQQAWMGQQGMLPGAEGSEGVAQAAASPAAKLGIEGFPAPRNSREAFELAKVALQTRQEERKAEHLKQKEINKETQPFYESILAGEEAAKGSEKRLNRMEQLVKEGGLPYSGLYAALKGLEEHATPASAGGAGGLVGAAVGGPVGAGIGSVVGALISPVASVLRSAQRNFSPNAEEFEKLSNDFVREAKSIFGGGRLTDADLRAFLAMIPTLSNTDEGKLAIIRNMRNFNKAAEIKAKALKDIIKENDGRRPANLQVLLEERVAPDLKKLANQFEKGLGSAENEVNKILDDKTIKLPLYSLGTLRFLDQFKK